MKILTIAVQTKGHGSYARQRRIADALIEHGHEVLWFAPDTLHPGRERLFKVPEVPSWLPVPRPVRWQLRLRKAFNAYRDELRDVDAIFTVREYDALACILDRDLKSKPQVFFQRGDTIECERFNFKHPVRTRDRFVRPLTLMIYLPLQKWLLPRLDLTVLQAQFLADMLQARMPQTRFSHEVVANDCEIRWVHEADENDGEDRLLAVKDPAVPLIGMVAPVYWHGKGFGVFLDGMVELKKRIGSGFRAAIVGYGPEEWRVRDFIRDNNLEEQVFFVGRIQGAYRYMHIFDIMVMPTKMVDACPNVVLEAIRANVAIQASDIAAHRNLLGEDADALIFRSEDGAHLGEKLDHLINTPGALEENRAMVRERELVYSFDWDAEVSRVVEAVGRREIGQRFQN
ncbi:MAG: glycosyltransferase family 4 protein [Gammaproteobacteria bacterium]